MIQVQIVPPDHVYTVWDKVKPLIEASLNVGFGYTTIDQVKLLLTKGLQTLLVAVDEGEFTGAMVVEFVNYPNERVVFLVELGGKAVVDQSVLDQVEDWARQNGATRMCAWADDVRARLYKMKSGFTTARHVVEKKL
jgi:hypothetical protein